MTRYAEGTTVPIATTKSELEQLVRKYKATRFALYHDEDRAAVAFTMADRQIRFVIARPKRSAFARNKRGQMRTPAQITNAVEAADRQQWRALLLVIKAKLESIESGIETFDEAFLAQVVMPDGKTAGEHAAGAIKIAYEKGTSVPLLPLGS